MKNSIKLLLALTAFGYTASSFSSSGPRKVKFTNKVNVPVKVEVHTTAEVVRIDEIAAGQTKDITLQPFDADSRTAVVTTLRVERPKGNKTKIAAIYEQDSAYKDWKDRAQRFNKEYPDKELEVYYNQDLDYYLKNVKFENKGLINKKFTITATAKDEDGKDKDVKLND